MKERGSRVCLFSSFFLQLNRIKLKTLACWSIGVLRGSFKFEIVSGSEYHCWCVWRWRLWGVELWGLKVVMRTRRQKKKRYHLSPVWQSVCQSAVAAPAHTLCWHQPTLPAGLQGERGEWCVCSVRERAGLCSSDITTQYNTHTTVLRRILRNCSK